MTTVVTTTATRRQLQQMHAALQIDLERLEAELRRVREVRDALAVVVAYFEGLPEEPEAEPTTASEAAPAAVTPVTHITVPAAADAMPDTVAVQPSAAVEVQPEPELEPTPAQPDAPRLVGQMSQMDMVRLILREAAAVGGLVSSSYVAEGLVSMGVDPVRAKGNVSALLASLRTKGEAESPEYGMWRLAGAQPASVAATATAPLLAATEPEPNIPPQYEPVTPLVVEGQIVGPCVHHWVMGQGLNAPATCRNCGAQRQYRPLEPGDFTRPAVTAGRA